MIASEYRGCLRPHCYTSISALKHQVKLCSAYLFLVVCCWPAMAQMNTGHGTIVLAYLSQREGIVAADSRITRKRSQTTLHFDNCCKIVALSDHVLVALSGVTDTCTIIGYNCDWDAANVAQEAFRKVHTTDTNELVKLLASTWSSKMSRLLWQTYFRQPKQATIDAPGNVPLAAAFFMAVDQAGIIHCAAGQVRYEIFAMIHIWPEKPRIFPIPPTGHWVIPFMGTGAPIIREFLHGGTERADEERRQWSPALRQGVGTTEEVERNAIHLVELGIQFMPRDKWGRETGVGGPIDAAKLTVNGITWLRKKKDCPKKNR
jgi:hypothetical protein